MSQHQKPGFHPGSGLFPVAGFISVGALGLLLSCTPAPPPNPTAPPVGATVQAAGTQVGEAAGAVATAVQTGVVQPAVGTVQAQATEAREATATAVAPAADRASTALAPTVVAVHTDVIAPTSVAAATNVAQAGATVQSAATDVTAMRQATATAVAPTAQAVATRVAPTVGAVATQAVSAAGTSVAQSPVQVVNVMVDNADTTVAVKNNGSSPISLDGWTLVMGPNMSLLLGDIPLDAGQTRTLHFSQGIDTQSDVFLGFGSNVASASLSPGAHVVLVAPPDNTIASVFSIT